MPVQVDTDRIAIVGLGGLFPGAATLDEFWQNILQGRDSGRTVPAQRWYLPPDQAYAPWPPQPDRVYSTWGCFLDEFTLNPAGLNLDARLLALLDPLFHIGLFAARAAYQDARQLTGIDPRRVGVILGNIALPTESTSALCREILGRTFLEKLVDTAAQAARERGDDAQAVRLADPALLESLRSAFPPSTVRRRDWHPWNRFAAGLPASLIAHGLGLGGLAFTLDAACASSLYALKFAADELLSHRADAMLAGGMSRPDCQYTQMGFTQLQALSRSGRCAPLSARADGLVVGEGAGVFVLKRLSDAIRHGDVIHGVIAGIGLSNDRGANLLAPHSEGQLRAMRAAYAQAGWVPSDVDLIECHATGTPVGDGVEIASLNQLWQSERARPGQCVLGGVKSNVGHLLTGAGAAGLMKVLSAIRHETLPATANFTEPAAGLLGADCPFRVLTRSETWSRRSASQGEVIPRRATVNAFGFGGINAHVLVEEWLGTASHSGVSTSSASPSPLSITLTGLDAQIGTADSRTHVQQLHFRGQTPDSDILHWWGVESSRWYQREIGPVHEGAVPPAGLAGIAETRLPLGEFRIPPVEMSDMLPQQQLMLKVAAGALRDARLAGTVDPNRIGMIVGIELDPNTTNFHFRWAVEADAAAWAERLGLDLSPDQHAAWVDSLKAACGPPLTPNRVMGNLGGIVASRLAREFDVGGPCFTVSCGAGSDRVAAELAVRALERGELDAALAGGVVLGSDPRWQAFVEQPREPERLADLAEAVVLQAAPAGSGPLPGYALVREDPVAGTNPPPGWQGAYPQVGSALVAGNLVRSTLEVYHELTPDPQLASSDGTPVFLPFEPALRTLQVRPYEPRALTLQPLSAASVFHGDRRRPLGPLPCGLFVVDGQDRTELQHGLNRLQRLSDEPGTVESLAIRWYHAAPPDTRRRLALVILASSREELQAQFATATRRLGGAAEDAESPVRRVFFTTEPLHGRLAFVFPGSGNAFRNMGRELLTQFPEILRRQARENRELAAQYSLADFWSPDFDPARVPHKTLIFGQVAMGTAVCDLLEQFAIRPDASLGYSLGESAAFFGLRAWTDRDEMLQRMRRSPLFGSDLVAPFDAARAAWGIPAGTPVPWTSGTLNRSAEVIRTALARLNLPRLYLLIVNTPQQCVIGGDPASVEHLARDLAGTYVPLPSPSTVHCPVLRSVEAAYRALHLMPTRPPQNPAGDRAVTFYSTGWSRAITPTLTRELAADAIVAQAIDTIDFPRVVRQAYEDGIRVFVEVGPGSSCSRMIGECLAGQPHVARSALPMTARPIEAFLELLATLITHRVPVDLGSLYGMAPAQIETSRTPREIVTRVGGLPFVIPEPPGGWQFRAGLQSFVASPTLCPSSQPDGVAGSEPGIVARDHDSQSSVLPDSEPERVFVRDDSIQQLWNQFALMTDHRTQAHAAFLRLSARYEQLAAEHLAAITGLAARPAETADADADTAPDLRATATATANASHQEPATVRPSVPVIPETPPRALNRDQCLQFAVGRIGEVLGRPFAAIDAHPTRVRLPDEPLMLVDRILAIEGEPLSMTSGRVVTEHDILPGKWYLDCGRIPTCIAVEAGQADLFLSGWLGIDFETRGHACYRLLDAVVTFHDALPAVGEVIHYDIRVLHFFRQGNTFLFRFEFDATVNGKPLLTMREGCAGFFTEAELAGGKGIVHTALDQRPQPGRKPADWQDPVPLKVESLSDTQLLALRRKDLAGCFGEAFAGLRLVSPVTIPGLDEAGRRSRMWLLDRVLKLDPSGGRFGLGQILGELDIRPDDWFLTCHFCDDQVMPGTLMYECCLHTLRVYLLRMGWIGESGAVVYEPVPGIRSRLKCRGQVLSSTRKVWYEVTLKEVGYGDPEDSAEGSAYCLADALMYADGKPIVEITDMSVRLTGVTRAQVSRLWQAAHPSGSNRQSLASGPQSPRYDRRPPLFDTDRITAFATGKPSDAFGDRYRPFDESRKIARLPGPPFQFLDRIVAIENCEPWVLKAGGPIVAQYDVPVDAWYFAANRQTSMPFAVLLETALQPCGWLAAYLGSALTSETDLSFRNLGGKAIQYRDVTSRSGTLTTTVTMTRVSNSAGMIIQHYDFDLQCDGESVYTGTTYFGFFSKAALANQVGIREATVYAPPAAEASLSRLQTFPRSSPFPDDQFRMIQSITHLATEGGPHGWGSVIGTMPVDPTAWFFKAHFYEDPVVPGSLGLESFWQLLKAYAVERWSLGAGTQFEIPARTPATASPGKPGAANGEPAAHEWVYRGQVIPRDQLVTVTAVIRQVDDAQRIVTGEGFLSVDGRVIYQMKDFRLAAR